MKRAGSNSGRLGLLSIAIASSLFWCPVFSSPASAQSVEDALALAYRNNLDLKAARARLRAEDQLRSEARAAGRPQVFISGSVTQNPSNFDNTIDGRTGIGSGSHAGHVHKQGKPTPFPTDLDTLDLLTTRDTDLVTKTVGINIVQPVYEGFRIRNSIREVDAHVSASRARFYADEQNLFIETIEAYLSVAAARASVALSQENVQLLEQQLAEVRARLDSNRVTPTDLAQATARVALAQTRLMDAEARLVTSEVTFSGKVGQAPGQLARDIPVPELPGTVEEALAIAEKNNPEILAASAELEAAGYSLRVAKGKFQPKVDAVANYGQTYDSLFEGNDVENSSVSLQLSMPLYQGGKEYAAVRRARYSERAWTYELGEAREQVENALRIEWKRYLSASASLQATELAVLENQRALEGVRQENRNGQRTVLEVLNAESENLNAKIALIQLRQRMLQSAFALRRLTGTMTAEALGLDVAAYDAESRSDRDARKWLGYGVDKD